MKPIRKRQKMYLVPLIGLLIGICILAYYPASDLYFSILHETQKTHIDREVSVMKSDAKKKYLKQAAAYNRYLVTHVPSEHLWSYEDQLSVMGRDQPFATLLIPKIDLTMQIYHGTDTEVLANGVGHLKGSSLPVGGKSTHAVLTAHSGMRGMRAFDDIRELENGDCFLIDVLGKKLAYEVYDQETVLPEEVFEKIRIQNGRDLCTLITCTPYGINDHRLLIHAKRCRYSPRAEKKRPPVREIAGNRRLVPLEGALILACLIAVPGFIGRRRRCGKKNRMQSEDEFN